MVYSDILEVLEKADSDGRHLEDKMQKLEEFQWTGKLESVYCCKIHSTCCNSPACSTMELESHRFVFAFGESWLGRDTAQGLKSIFPGR